MAAFIADIRYATRSLTRSPWFTVLVGTLGLAIGGTTALFSDAVLLRQLPFRDPQQLVEICSTATIRTISTRAERSHR